MDWTTGILRQIVCWWNSDVKERRGLVEINNIQDGYGVGRMCGNNMPIAAINEDLQILAS